MAMPFLILQPIMVQATAYGYKPYKARYNPDSTYTPTPRAGTRYTPLYRASTLYGDEILPADSRSRVGLMWAQGYGPQAQVSAMPIYAVRPQVHVSDT